MITAKERELMEHATGWQHTTNPFYRNHFAATPGSEDDESWKSLCARGFAAFSGRYGEITCLGFYSVTDRGLDALGPPRTRSGKLMWRRRKVQDLRGQGLSRTVVAERLGITERQVRTAEKPKK